MPFTGNTFRPKRGTSLAERVRARIDPDWLIEIAESVASGDPQVRVIDTKTGMPRLAKSKHPGADPGVVALSPAQVRPDERITEVVWPKPSERMDAITWLRDTAGWKPPAEMNVSVSKVEASVDFTRLSGEELEAYVALCEKMGLALAEGGLDEDAIDAEAVEVPDDGEDDER